ncbi:MAG: DNA primase [Lachnospiraceae bacterium]|nr:DNA primase [Lachnospiraceae bacterium]
MIVFSKVKYAVSTRDAASFYGLKISRNGMCLCPFHNDKNPSMKVEKNFYCFGCQARGDVIDFVRMLFNINAKEAAIKLINDFGLQVDMQKKGSEKEKNERIRRTKEKVYKENVQYAYETELKRFHSKISEFLLIFREWEKEKTPTKEHWEENKVDEKYIFAMNNKERLEYILDILESDNDEERFEIFKQRKGIIEYYDRKVKEIK